MLNRFFAVFQSTRQDNLIVLPSLPIVMLCISKTIQLSYWHSRLSAILGLGKTILNCLTETTLLVVLLRAYIYIYKTIVQDNSIVLLIILHLLHLPTPTHTVSDLCFSSFSSKTCWFTSYQAFACWFGSNRRISAEPLPDFRRILVGF